MIKWTTFIIAAIGFFLAVYTAATAQHEAPKAPLSGVPSVNPYARGIAATGQVEGASRNLTVAAPEGAVVTRVFVEVGQTVKAGDALFELDSRPLQADLVRAKSARDAANAALSRLRAQPRAETIPPLEAAVESARAEVEDKEKQLSLWRSITDRRAVTEDVFNQVQFAAQGARARLALAQSNLNLAKAGAWSQDVDVATAELAQAQAQVDAVQILIDRRTVRAPIAGTILKRNVEPGQFASTDPTFAAMVLGDLTQLNIRARVDEEDLPSLRAGSKGQARVRGQKAILVPLSMIRIEPLAQAKTQLSGSTTERVDTRVLEVLFRVDAAGNAPLYPGQLVDVFIDSGPD